MEGLEKTAAQFIGTINHFKAERAGELSALSELLRSGIQSKEYWRKRLGKQENYNFVCRLIWAYVEDAKAVKALCDAREVITLAYLMEEDCLPEYSEFVSDYDMMDSGPRVLKGENVNEFVKRNLPIFREFYVKAGLKAKDITLDEFNQAIWKADFSRIYRKWSKDKTKHVIHGIYQRNEGLLLKWYRHAAASIDCIPSQLTKHTPNFECDLMSILEKIR